MIRKWNVGWGPISSCNMHCAFCYSKEKRQSTLDLKLNDWIRFIDSNADRINSINYGTGENTLSSDWFTLISYIRNNYPAIRQSLTTNGYLSEAIKKDPSNLNAFISAVDEVDVSLDFPDADQHNLFRGQPKAYSWALDTLRLCNEYKKRTTIVFLGSKVNVSKEQVDGLFAIAKEYNTILRMNLYRPTEGINNHSERFLLDYQTIVRILNYISKKYHILALNDSLFSTILTGKTIDDPSGDRSIRILSDGNITPSTYLIKDNYVIGNIQEKMVLERLERENSTWSIVHKHIPEACKECIFSQTCAGGVYDRRFLWSGTLECKDPYCPHTFTTEPERTIQICHDHFESVHDGYLPTMFFKP